MISPSQTFCVQYTTPAAPPQRKACKKPLPGKNGGPAILPQGAFLRLLGEAESSAH